MTQSPNHSASDTPLPSAKERRKLREARSMSEQEVAAALGVTRATVRAWESGRSDPRGRRRAAYAKLLAAAPPEAAPDITPDAVPDAALDVTPDVTPAEQSVAAGAPASVPGRGHEHETGPGPVPVSAQTAAETVTVLDRGTDTNTDTGTGTGTATDTGTDTGPAAAAPAEPEPGAGAPVRADTAAPGSVPPPERTVPAVRAMAHPGAPNGSPPGGPGQDSEPHASGDGTGPARTPRWQWPILSADGGFRSAQEGSAPVPERLVPERPVAPGAVPEGTDPAGAVPEGPAPADAFDALYDRTVSSLIRQAYLLTGRQRLSHECVERAFRLAWQHWPEVARDRDPAGWVRAAAYEFAMSPWQRLRPAHRHPDTPSLESEPSALLEALLSLPPAYRRTVLLYDGLGLDLPETAAETEASTPAAANRVLHAREAIAEQLPGLASPEALHQRLTELADAFPAPEPATAASVREGSERHVWLWTRTALTVTALIVSATGFTLMTAPQQYDPGVPTGRPVGGVPALAGPQAAGPDSGRLPQRPRDDVSGGPGRLVPEAR
ncbi:transcriptional regulator [Streptomyces clavuligerus]|uniref:RNA polymerase, sigma-24 subunit, ECF subfamily n=1 Tax=Streptomyces clavuligerus TaxID=1901 RepID=E2Q389_STRCL|nr:transcriptional regulator [Streptomyces clavuligerus]ANW21875.1 RNA polymerase subunit sigma-24 [Streptomyces clavuligerus]AXU13105.1 helix-turn-helix domain-containing protein [Streptomyces clavuligerus]EFG08804.1 RNA polymerase, sigma-24 subunit, ECF subfamily [Streptomyces clavuligerus]MBY6303044.1 helix-turn-helix domain-containing protein [Streptomyces clavuligerus]QCS09271.1 transcriptional regulator [Streptomyces clavuligerus]